MPEIVTNEMILEHLRALQEVIESARMERREIRDEIRALKDQVSALKSALDRDEQEEKDEQAEAELAQKVATLDN